MNEDKMFVKPSREGLVVRDPDSLQRLPESGAWKPRAGFWMRRLLVGDVVEVAAPADVDGTPKGEHTDAQS